MQPDSGVPLGLWYPDLTASVSYGLESQPEKTKIIFLPEHEVPPGESEHISVDFPGCAFRGRLARGPERLLREFFAGNQFQRQGCVGQRVRHWHLNRRLANLSGPVQSVVPPTGHKPGIVFGFGLPTTRHKGLGAPTPPTRGSTSVRRNRPSSWSPLRDRIRKREFGARHGR